MSIHDTIIYIDISALSRYRYFRYFSVYRTLETGKFQNSFTFTIVSKYRYSEILPIRPQISSFRYTTMYRHHYCWRAQANSGIRAVPFPTRLQLQLDYFRSSYLWKKFSKIFVRPIFPMNQTDSSDKTVGTQLSSGIDENNRLFWKRRHLFCLHANQATAH